MGGECFTSATPTRSISIPHTAETEVSQGRDLKRFGCNRIGAAALCILLMAGYAGARGRHPQSWAETQFGKAESPRETLEASPEQSPPRREHQTVIASHRPVVLESPQS